MVSERLAFLLGPGGWRAACFFCLKVIVRIDVFRLVWTSAALGGTNDLPPRWRYLCIDSVAALDGLNPTTVEHVASKCGADPRLLLEGGGSLHLLMSGAAVAAQLTIVRGPKCELNSPPLSLRMTDADAFLGYLYTWSAHRRQGAASALIDAAVGDLATRNTKKVYAHIRATNVPSLAAFEHAGWKTCSTILCTLKGDLVVSFGAEDAGLVIRSSKRIP